MPARIDHQFDIAVGKSGYQIADDFNRRVGGILNAEYDLHRAWIILPAEAGQIGAKIRLSSGERLEYGDGGIDFGERSRRSHESASGPSRQKRVEAANRGGRVAHRRRKVGRPPEELVHPIAPANSTGIILHTNPGHAR
jgi:hypothetical protein